jgi:hypothetical protein
MTAFRRGLRWGVVPLAGAVLLASLLAPVVLTHGSLAGASALHVAASPPQEWTNSTRYVDNLSESLNGSQLLGSFQENTSSVLIATNTTNTTVELEQLVVEESSSVVSYCVPSCSAPTGSLVESEQGSSQGVGFLNLTTTATVLENGTSLAALGVLNASQWSHAASTFALNLTGNVSGPLVGPLGSGNPSGASYQNDTVSMIASFATPLGLVPWTPSGSTPWNSTAPYTATFSQNFSFNSTLPTIGVGWGGSGNGTSGNGSGRSPSPSPTGPPPPFGVPVPYCGLGNGSTGYGLALSSGFPNSYNNSTTWNGTECVAGAVLTDPWDPNASGIELGFEGPFALPSTLLAFLASSDLFGGAGNAWVFASPTFYEGSPGNNSSAGIPPGGGTAGGPPFPGAPPPIPPPFPGLPHGPYAPGGAPSSHPTSSSSSAAAPMMEAAWVVAAVVLASLAGLAVLLTSRRRR